MADYLEAYAHRFDLPVLSGAAVDGLEKNGDGYVVTAAGRRSRLTTWWWQPASSSTSTR
jgi:putative flavoprotein involved in K+ transport